MTSFQTKEGVSVAKQVPANTTDTETYAVRRDATVESVQVRIYQGAENDLHLKLQVRRRGTEQVDNLVQRTGKSYIDGDDDVYHFDISAPVENGDKLRVWYDNNDGANAHNFRVNFDLDYLSGLERIKGVFS